MIHHIGAWVLEEGFLFSRPLPAEAFASLLAASGRNLPMAPAIAEPVALRPDA